MTDLKPCRIISHNDPRWKNLLLPSENVEDPETQVKPFLDRARSELQRTAGIAVAAPQIGIHFRWFIDNEQVYLNPEITDSFDQVDITEGCLSFPNKWFVCTRYKTINVKYLTLDLETKVDTLTNIESFIFQHEIDHLNGVLINSHGKRLQR